MPLSLWWFPTSPTLLRLESRVEELSRQIERIEIIMADNSPLLNQLATDLRTFAAGPFAAVLAENARLATRNAELEGEDAAETSAADSAVAAFNELAAPVTASPDVPVEIPPVEAPAVEVPAEPDSGDTDGTTDTISDSDAAEAVAANGGVSDPEPPTSAA